MPITYKTGNAVSALIDGEIDVLLHVCNNKGVMGSGIALEIKNRVPNAWYEYKGDPVLGEVTIGIYGDRFNGGVYNMVAQAGYGKGIRHLNYGALADCLHQAAIEASYSGSPTIGLPYKMGADRAGGEWEIVLELVEYFLKDFNVVIYKLEG